MKITIVLSMHISCYSDRPKGYGIAFGDRRMKSSSDAEVKNTLKYLQHLLLLPKTAHKVSKVCHGVHTHLVCSLITSQCWSCVGGGASVLSLWKATPWKWLFTSWVHSRSAVSVKVLPGPQPIPERRHTSPPAGGEIWPAQSRSSEISVQEQTTSAWCGRSIQSGPDLPKRRTSKALSQWPSYSCWWYDIIFIYSLHEKSTGLSFMCTKQKKMFIRIAKLLYP